MIQYILSFDNFLDHFISIEGIFNTPENEIFLQLASWRPGRYELANYAKNIQFFEIIDEHNNVVPFQKTAKDQWKINTENVSKIFIRYKYFAFTMDAGNSYVDEQQVYINFINCIPALIGRENEEIQVDLNLPQDYQIACSLKEKKKHQLLAKNYYELADSPMIASNSLQHKSYQVEGYQNTNFHLWIQGEYEADWEKILNDFIPFSKQNIDVFGEFPCQDYLFLIQVLPYQHYHGVEHSNSTVIVLGQNKDDEEPVDFYDDFLGVSCHELFHTWNICRIRPTEMMPYDYSKEAYFDTGFIAEGVTTYYGDYLLGRSNVFSEKQYFNELNRLFQRHFHNYGRLNASLAESSCDLWLDGYQVGIPHRKVSIYVKGALIALLLDINIRKETNNEKSLDDVIRLMWERFGKTGIGYTTQDYENCIADIINPNFAKEYIQQYVYGKKLLEEPLQKALSFIGCEFKFNQNPLVHEFKLGCKVIQREDRWIVHQIAPNSPASKLLSIRDEIILIDEEKVTLETVLSTEKENFDFTIIRNKSEKIFSISSHQETYYPISSIEKKEQVTNQEKINFTKWLNMPFDIKKS